MAYGPELRQRLIDFTALTSAKFTDIMCKMDSAGRFGNPEELDKQMCLLLDLRNLSVYLWLQEFKRFQEATFSPQLVVECDEVVITPATQDITRQVDCGQESTLTASQDISIAFLEPELVDWPSVSIGAVSSGIVAALHEGGHTLVITMAAPTDGTYTVEIVARDLNGNGLDLITVTFIISNCSCNETASIEHIDCDDSPTITQL